MTTTAMRPIAAYTSSVTGHPVGFLGAARSEWIKVTSLRSTVTAAAAMVVLWNGFVALVSYSQARSAAGEVATGPGSRPPGFLSTTVVDSASQASAGAIIAQLVVVVLAGLAVAGEYSTGTIRTTLMAVPNRTMVLVAKVVVIGGSVLALSLLGAFSSFAVASAMLSTEGLDTGITDPHQLQIVIGSALYVTIAALLAIGVAAVLRAVAATIAVTIAMLLLLPMLASALPTDWSDTIRPWLPSVAGMQIMAAPDASAVLQPWQGLGVFAGYAVLAIVGGFWVLRRRDA